MTGRPRLARLAALGLAAATAVVAGLLSPAPALAAPPMRTVEIATVPAVPGVRFVVDGTVLVTGRDGTVSLSVKRSREHHRLELRTPEVQWDGWTARFARWGNGPGEATGGPTPAISDFVVGRDLRFQVGFEVGRTVGMSLVDQDGRPADPARVSTVELRADNGEPLNTPGIRPVFLWSTRPVVEAGRLVAKGVVYSVAGVTVDGAQVVDAGRQRVDPGRSDQFDLAILLRDMRIRVVDRFFGVPVDARVTLTAPDGTVDRLSTAEDGTVAVGNRPRGTYRVRVTDGGWSASREVLLSRDQDLEMPVITPIDLALLGVGLAVVAAGLVMLRRRTRPLPPPEPGHRDRAEPGARERDDVAARPPADHFGTRAGAGADRNGAGPT